MSLAIDLPDDPGVDALAPDDRALVARIWTERSAAEQRAAVIFTMIARDLLVDGAIPEVLELATRAVHDELRHVEICRQVASRYAGAPVPWPAPEPASEPAFRDAPPDLTRALHVVLDTCIAESVGATFLQVCRADAEGPLVRAALQQLLRDDIGHARIGWAHLASAADVVAADRPHGPLAVAVEHVAGRQVQRVGVVDAAARAQVLARVLARDAVEVADLAAVGVGDAQDLAALDQEGDAAVRGDPVAHARARAFGLQRDMSEGTGRCLVGRTGRLARGRGVVGVRLERRAPVGLDHAAAVLACSSEVTNAGSLKPIDFEILSTS